MKGQKVYLLLSVFTHECPETLRVFANKNDAIVTANELNNVRKDDNEINEIFQALGFKSSTYYSNSFFYHYKTELSKVAESLGFKGYFYWTYDYYEVEEMEIF